MMPDNSIPCRIEAKVQSRSKRGLRGPDSLLRHMEATATTMVRSGGLETSSCESVLEDEEVRRDIRISGVGNPSASSRNLPQEVDPDHEEPEERHQEVPLVCRWRYVCDVDHNSGWYQDLNSPKGQGSPAPLQIPSLFLPLSDKTSLKSAYFLGASKSSRDLNSG